MAHPFGVAVFPVITVFVTASVPLFSTPAPLTAFETLPLEILAANAVPKLKILKLGVFAAALRWIVNRFGPGPLILRLRTISGRAVFNVIGLVTPLKLTSIVSHEESALIS